MACSSAGPIEADALPEQQYYKSFGFKLSASSLFSLFHSLCLKGPQIIRAPMATSQLYISHLNVLMSSSSAVDLCQVSPLTSLILFLPDQTGSGMILSLLSLFFASLSKPDSSCLPGKVVDGPQHPNKLFLCPSFSCSS